MNVAVRYQSKSGNTKQVAEAIAKAADTSAQSVESSLDAPVDVLFVGGAIYAGMLNGKLKRFLKGLSAGQAKKIAVFSTAAGDGTIRAKVEKIIGGKGFNIASNEFHATSEHLKTNQTKVLEDAAQFAKNITAE